MIDNDIRSRCSHVRSIKQSPTSRISLRQQVLNNCIDTIKSKRNSHLNLLRNNYIIQRCNSNIDCYIEETNNRKELIENFVNDIYYETLRDLNMNANDAEFSIDVLSEILLGIETEMQEFEINAYEEQLHDEEAIEQYAQYALYDEFCTDYSNHQYDAIDNNIICPICMQSNMNIDNDQPYSILSCTVCGIIINLIDSSMQIQTPISVEDFKSQLAHIYESHAQTCENCIQHNLPQITENETMDITTDNTADGNFNIIPNTNMSKDSNYKYNNSSYVKSNHNTLRFHMNNTHLYAYCSDCALNIQVI